MKNKEIEELLNKLKNTADTSFFAVCGSEEELDKMPRGVCKFLSLNDKQAKLLLSYIEQLEKENEKANKYIDFYKDLTEKQNKSLEEFKQENKQLENNRDKALKKLNKYRNRKDHYGLWCMDYGDNADIIHILKGDNK